MIADFIQVTTMERENHRAAVASPWTQSDIMTIRVASIILFEPVFENDEWQGTMMELTTGRRVMCMATMEEIEAMIDAA